MGLRGWWARFVEDPWGAVKTWRQKREEFIPKENRAKVTYDVYPDRDVPPTIKMYVEARDVRGRLLRQYVELEGYSVHQLNWKSGATRGGVLVRDWFVGQVLEALVILSARLDEERDRKEQERNG